MKKTFDAIDSYVGDLFLKKDAALDATIKSIHEAGMPQISIFPNQGAFLQILIRISKARRILEIGTLGGYSSIWLARGLPDDGKLVTIELQEKYAAVARKNIERAKLLDKVDIRIGDAVKHMKTMIHEKEPDFDIIFLDAHKPSYEQYLELSLPLTHPGSLIIADNAIYSGEVVNSHSKDELVLGIRRFNKALANHPKLEATILPTISQKGLDGIAIAVVL